MKSFHKIYRKSNRWMRSTTQMFLLKVPNPYPPTKTNTKKVRLLWQLANVINW
nr:MAG TPA: hypothetical protein [Caudoviricetes sp.]